ncbi:hypothetical protein BDP27DRAFT_1414984 [Rhodocollybia butyracea]|uniref:Uncharacterized protein n=1 Tax=Rhodocollybia butyracea TaxID=206335 RepID=A0A9P5Q722_9AGAR|nr:hypothetical protein BDP27DRAFT_1414984 [Rhodocollybia butyracea]
MLIRLIPSASQPTVLFKLVFENLPDSLPVAWANQLAALDSDDLEIPELMHALDKAVGVQSILDQVTFDLVEQKIKCVFSDGELEQWDIASGYQGLVDDAVRQRKIDLVRKLDSVIDDVNQSALEMDKERKREEAQRQQQKAKEAAKPEEITTVPTDQKRPRHKKQRSLLMNLVSSLIPLSLNSPRTPRSLPSPSRPTSPTSSICSSRSERLPAQTGSAPTTLSRAATLPTLKHKASHRVSVDSLSSALHSPLSYLAPLAIVGPPPPPPLSPRALRRRARSSLVDAFRLHVLPELTRRVRTSSITGSPVLAPAALYGSETFAPYYSWIVVSTLKRVDARLSKTSQELRDEMDAVGIDSSTLSIDALPGRDSGYITGPATPTVQAPSGSASGDNSDGDSSLRSGSEAESETESCDADSVSDSVTLIGSSLSVSGDDLAAFRCGQPKPSLCDHSTPLSPPPYLKTVSSTFDIPTSAPLALPEVPLPEYLNDLLTQHNEFSKIHLRLVHLLLSVHARAAAAAAEITQRETILEVRGRRRAWLNRALKAQDGSIEPTKPNPSWGAMGSPFRPSGLGKYSFTSDKWDCDPFHYLEAPRTHWASLAMDSYPNPFESEADSYASYLYTHRRKRSGDTSIGLLPVCEEESTDGPETVGSFFYHKERHRYLDIEIDEDSEDEEDSDTDIDPLVDVELNPPGDDDAVFKKPSHPFSQIGAFKGSATLTNLGMDGKIITKGAVDPFDGESSLSAPLVMVAAANISKRMKSDMKTDNHVHPDQ